MTKTPRTANLHKSLQPNTPSSRHLYMSILVDRRPGHMGHITPTPPLGPLRLTPSHRPKTVRVSVPRRACDHIGQL
eukprot:11161298-Heterocapsa_arctica.AAC.1